MSHAFRHKLLPGVLISDIIFPFPVHHNCLRRILEKRSKKDRSCRKIYGSSRPSICVASVLIWSLEYAGTILSETPRSSPPPIFPVSRTSWPRGETHCLVTWWDLTIILRLIVLCPRSRRLEPVPVLTPACADAQAARATRGYSSSVTVPHSASTLNGPGPPVVGIPGWRNGPLLSTRSDDDDDDDDDGGKHTANERKIHTNWIHLGGGSSNLSSARWRLYPRQFSPYQIILDRAYRNIMHSVELERVTADIHQNTEQCYHLEHNISHQLWMRLLAWQKLSNHFVHDILRWKKVHQECWQNPRNNTRLVRITFPYSTELVQTTCHTQQRVIFREYSRKNMWPTGYFPWK